MKTNLTPRSAQRIKRNLLLGAALFIISLLSSCSKENDIVPVAANDTQSLEVNNTSTGQQAQQNILKDDKIQSTGQQYRLIVAFKSEGAGIDKRGMNSLMEFIQAYQQQIGKQIVYQSIY